VKMKARILRTRSCRNSGSHSWKKVTCIAQLLNQEAKINVRLKQKCHSARRPKGFDRH
jgi:hypothetical protein